MAAAASHPEPPGHASASRQTALLYERHRRRLLGLCRGRLDRAADAEDALQQTFVYALRCLDRGVVPENESAWLNTIAENVCRAWLRQSGARTRREVPADAERVPEPRSGADRAADAHDLTAALAVLPFEQRRALLLREWQGLSYREVAAELATTEAAVETLIFRARRRAAAALRDARRLLDVGTALAGARKAAGSLGAKGGAAAAAAGCVTVAATVPVVRAVEPHRHVTRPARATTHAVLPGSAISPATPATPQPRRSRAHVPARPRKARVALTRDAQRPVPLAPAAPTAPPPAAAPGPAAPAPATPAVAPAVPAPPPAAPPAAGGAADSAVNAVGSALDTATTAVGSVVEGAAAAVPPPPALPVPAPASAPVPALPAVTTPALP